MCIRDREIERRGGGVGPLEHYQRLGTAQERGVIRGHQGERLVEAGEGPVRLAEPELDGAERGARHGAIAREGGSLAIRGRGILEPATQDRHVAGPECLPVAVEESVAHRSRGAAGDNAGARSRERRTGWSW